MNHSISATWQRESRSVVILSQCSKGELTLLWYYTHLWFRQEEAAAAQCTLKTSRSNWSQCVSLFSVSCRAGTRAVTFHERAADSFHVSMIPLSTDHVIMGNQMTLRCTLKQKSLISESQTTHTGSAFGGSPVKDGYCWGHPDWKKKKKTQCLCKLIWYKEVLKNETEVKAGCIWGQCFAVLSSTDKDQMWTIINITEYYDMLKGRKTCSLRKEWWKLWRWTTARLHRHSEVTPVAQPSIKRFDGASVWREEKQQAEQEWKSGPDSLHIVM